ncbi:GSCFA domain-containing protein [Aureitalea marina]|uniref:GSCFA domain-containing protein n=1 Tax=Aureitalea marina TaxID=930804 RepID=A0A2S7KLY8_9FLAO|nr:GSCFA domain-containing protein [Aureitalea marina]PQB03618.1 hypothetical protein BST85_00915 [Aureitalea marina]
MKFFTPVKGISEGENKIEISSEIFLSGSCFADRMADKLNYFRFNTRANPFGVIFHPVALANLYTRALNDQFFDHNDVFQNNGLWQSYWAHSSFSSVDREALIEQLNLQLKDIKKGMLESTHLVFTFGTAWGYTLIKNQQLVANCHKMPAACFEKKLSPPNEIVRLWKSLIQDISSRNSKLTVLLTVSPIRHLKDGLIQNSQSKANLLTAVHQLVDQFGCCDYFPAFEIMMDELRDYRFYDKDLIHPSSEAVDHIWDQFSTTWLDPGLDTYLKEIHQLNRKLAHRHLHPESEQAKAFDRQLETQIEQLKSRYPHLKNLE